MASSPSAAGPNPPKAFQVSRELPPRRYPLLQVFPGLDRVPAFRKYPVATTERTRLAEATTVRIAPQRGEWMYVAPHRVPPDADARWRPITARGDCVVVSGQHLRKSSSLVLYLDILHELYHVVQRRHGRELWDEAYAYVDRPTELEAYRFANQEARRLGVTDAFLRDYLRVSWVSPKEHRRLLVNLDVRPA
jgi:hypothetical protein